MPANQQIPPTLEASPIPIRPRTPVTHGAPALPTSPSNPDGEEGDISQGSSPVRPCENVRPDNPDFDTLEGEPVTMIRRQPSPIVRRNTPITVEEMQASFQLGDACSSATSISDIGPSWTKEDVSMEDIMHTQLIGPSWAKEDVSVDDIMRAEPAEEARRAVSMDDIMHADPATEARRAGTQASQPEPDDELLNASVGSMLEKYGADNRLWESSELAAGSLREDSLQRNPREEALESGD